MRQFFRLSVRLGFPGLSAAFMPLLQPVSSSIDLPSAALLPKYFSMGYTMPTCTGWANRWLL